LLVCQLINNDIVKVLVARPRPFQEWSNLHILIPKPKGFSFPSGHTSSSFAAAGAIYFSGNKKWSIPALILAALIGFSRLYFGVHYPTDVICGALLGFLISFVLSKLVIWPKEI
jgi:Membrane-associated phospholipid phosphatase